MLANHLAQKVSDTQPTVTKNLAFCFAILGTEYNCAN